MRRRVLTDSHVFGLMHSKRSAISSVGIWKAKADKVSMDLNLFYFRMTYRMKIATNRVSSTTQKNALKVT
jgi:hypothetical protein